MDARTVTDYASRLRALGRQMEAARPPRGDRDPVYLLTDIATRRPADLNESPYSLFYNNPQQWALAMSVANPTVVKIAGVIEKAISKEKGQDEG